MGKRDLSAIWTVLDTSPPDTGVVAVNTGYEVAAGELLAGIDGQRHRYLLVPLLAGEAARTDTKGQAVHLIRLSHAGSQYLAVTCLALELHTVFTQFSRELVASVEHADSPARAAVEAFERWKALFSDAVQWGTIGEEQLVGLLGELLTLEGLLTHHAPRELEYWCGPFGEAHDFRTRTRAVEVKATLVREGRIVDISSVDQLQAPPNADLWLIYHRLDRDPSGFGIADVTNRIMSLGAARDDLALGLAEHGINLDDLGRYKERRYRQVETRTYDVTGPAFPRITRSSFSGGDVPPGTLRFSYSIDLTNEPPSPLNTSEAERVLSAMAMEVAHGMGS